MNESTLFLIAFILYIVAAFLYFAYLFSKKDNIAKGIKKIIKEDDIVVFVIKNSKYSSKISQITKNLSEMSKKVCYISLNKPYANLVKMINKLKIAEDKIVVVDCVTKKVTSPKDTKNVVYVSSTQAFTEINITVNKVLKKESYS